MSMRYVPLVYVFILFEIMFCYDMTPFDNISFMVLINII